MHIDANPKMEASYWVPDLHNFPCEEFVDRRLQKEADRFYTCHGAYLYIHHVEGIPCERHVRVGYLIQFGKFVVKQIGMAFCFFATKGVNPLNIAGKKVRKKSEAKKAIAAS